MRKLPKSRSENIVVQNLEEEVLIYDLITSKAYCLNETSAKVYNACDGKTSFDELKRKYKFTDDLIYLALDDLRKEKLLDEKADYVSPLAGISRRAAIRQVGLATIIALPLISSLVAPRAADAQSGAATVACTGTCTQGTPLDPADVCSGIYANMSFTLIQYDSQSGLCNGAVLFNGNFSCGPDPVFSSFDICRCCIL